MSESIAKRAASKQNPLEAVAALLAKSGIDPESIDRVDKIRLSDYQSVVKNDEGEPEIIDLRSASIVLSPSWEAGPKFPLIQPAKPVKVTFGGRVERVKKVPGMRRAVILPDSQFGFRRLHDGEMEPFHDDRAQRIAIAIIRAAQPDEVIDVGDFLDLAEMSKYRQELGFGQTTQASIDAAHAVLAARRAAAPDARFRLLAGNHDQRMQNWILDHAKAAFGLRPAAEPPDSWPSLSLPSLLRFSDLDIEYIPGWPAGIAWLSPNLAVIHGQKLKVSQVVDDERVNIVQGHTHRIAASYKTRRTFDGPRTTFAATPGCLCRVDGAVPSMKGGFNERSLGALVPGAEDWQQGMMVLTYAEDGGPVWAEQITIFDGKAVWRDRLFDADTL
jgi:hypothetical protein